MISRVKGRLLRRGLAAAEIMTPGGVAYEIHIPLGVFERLPKEGAEIELRTHQVVREDAVELFGFLEERERALFARLLTVSGVGPRQALNLLSALTPERVVRAIVDGDVAALRRVQGFGTKRAERLILELADRLDDLAAFVPQAPGRVGEDAVGALVALGYSATQATVAVRRAIDEEGPIEGTALIKASLARVGG